MRTTRDALVTSMLCLSLATPAVVARAAPAEGEAEAAEGEGEGEGEGEVDEAKLEEAKGLYTQAEKLAKKKKWKEAMDLYEQAYYLVPGKHGFAMKVGTAAFEAGECDTAVQYLVHFREYADPEQYGDLHREARKLLKKLLEQGCVEEADLRGTHLSASEREERALELFTEAEGLAAENKWREAMDLYEQAYYLVPQKHGFAHKVGLAAHEAGDCDKAHEYLIHFVDYADPSKYGERMAEATKIINELEASGCVSGQEMEAHQLENPFEITHDFENEDDKRERGPGSVFLYAGAGALGLGVVGVVVGGVGFGLAGGSQSKLDELASPDPVTGYAGGDYSCRGVEGDQCPPTLEEQVRKRQLMGVLGVGIGGALIVGGAALIAVHVIRNNKKSGKSARLQSLGPMLVHGGAGASASLRF